MAFIDYYDGKGSIMKSEKFRNLGLSQESLDAVADMGFETPTKIQEETIPHILNGSDVIGHSQTGTGKTMAFGLPAIEIVNTESRKTQVLVLCPTRELAMQAAGEIRKAAVYKSSLSIAAIYGGASMNDQIRKLRDGAQIVVGTPGRIMDHMRRKTLKLDNLKLLVLDEADEMLNMGFREDIEIVLKDIPKNASMVLFSATMSKGIMQITKNYQTNAKVIQSTEKTKTVATIDQWHLQVKKPNKILAVDALLKYHTPKLTLIFCNTKRMVDALTAKLQQLGLSATALHGDLNQNARTRVMNGFRNGTTPILIASDVAARGIDVDDIELVINYDLPRDDEYYVHRIGRTGRAGRNGLAVSLVSGNNEKNRLREIERYAKVKIPLTKLPSQNQIKIKQNDVFIDKFKLAAESDMSEEYFNIIEKLVCEGFTERMIAATLLRMNLDNNQVTKPAIKPDINTKITPNSVKKSNTKKKDNVRFFINVGQKDRIKASDIVGCITGETGIASSSIGKIDIYDMFSFVEVESQVKNQVLDNINNKGVSIRNREISIEIAKDKR